MGKQGDLENSELHSKSKGFKSLTAVPSKRSSRGLTAEYFVDEYMRFHRGGKTQEQLANWLGIKVSSLYAKTHKYRLRGVELPYFGQRKLPKDALNNIVHEGLDKEAVKLGNCEQCGKPLLSRTEFLCSDECADKYWKSAHPMTHPSKTNDGGRNE